ncbi:MAG: PaaI family thioesterase [Acidimicrobiales bacterium]
MDPARRVEVATRLRALGHEFVARDLSDEALAAMGESVDELLAVVRAAPVRQRRVPRASVEAFALAVPEEGRLVKHQLFADSVVSGLANPMGLGAHLWRDGSAAVMEVTLGAAFEGAPGRSHGGVVAALVDETMGLVMGIQGVLAFTARLELTFRAPTPIGVPIVARAWLAGRDGRKLTILATVVADDEVVAEAEALFIEVDPSTFLEAAVEG